MDVVGEADAFLASLEAQVKGETAGTAANSFHNGGETVQTATEYSGAFPGSDLRASFGATGNGGGYQASLIVCLR